MPTIEQRERQANYLICVRLMYPLYREGTVDIDGMVFHENEFAKMFQPYFRYSRYELEHDLCSYPKVNHEK